MPLLTVPSSVPHSPIPHLLPALTVCPWKVLTGLSQPSRHTWMHMSVLQEAKVVLFCQSTSRAGAVGTGEQVAAAGGATPGLPSSTPASDSPQSMYMSEFVCVYTYERVRQRGGNRYRETNRNRHRECEGERK